MESILKDVKQKLANARELCPGMSNDMYLLTDYMSKHTNDTIVPMGVLVMVTCVMDDLEKGRNGFGGEFPEEVNVRKKFILNEIWYFPQVIDAIADEEFANQVRAEWKNLFGSEPPKKINTKEIETTNSYPEYIKVAVDWWANAISSPKFDNGDAMPAILAFMMASSAKEYTPDEIKIFKETLADAIKEHLERVGYCYLSVDYHPCPLLSLAGEKIGVDDMLGYPCKTYMNVSKEEVSVIAGYSAPKEILWTVSA